MGLLYNIGKNEKTNIILDTVQRSLNELQKETNCFWIELENGEVFMIDDSIKSLWVMRPDGTLDEKELNGGL